MKRTMSAVAVLFGLLALFCPTVESKVGKGQLMHFVKGRDIVMPDGSAGFTVDRETVAMVDPHDKNELKRFAAAAWMALDATAPLELTVESQAKYHPNCPQYQDALLSTVGPIVDTVDECTYGDPACANWKTKDRYDCWGPATNCMRKSR